MLDIAIGVLLVIVLVHFAVFYVVRTLYPPPAETKTVHVSPQSFTHGTNETPVPVEAPREEGDHVTIPVLQSAPVERDARVDPVDAQ